MNAIDLSFSIRCLGGLRKHLDFCIIKSVQFPEPKNMTREKHAAGKFVPINSDINIIK